MPPLSRRCWSNAAPRRPATCGWRSVQSRHDRTRGRLLPFVAVKSTPRSAKNSSVEVLHQLPHFGIFQSVITVPPLGHDRQKTAGYQQGKVLAGCGWGDSRGPGQLPRTEGLATEQSDAHFRPRRLAHQSAQGRQVDIDRHAPRLREGRFGPDRNVLFIASKTRLLSAPGPWPRPQARPPHGEPVPHHHRRRDDGASCSRWPLRAWGCSWSRRRPLRSTCLLPAVSCTGDRRGGRITRRGGGMAARAEVEVRIFLARANSSNWTALPPMEDPVHG